MDQITIGYLSWKRYNILHQTLSSHLNNGLFNIIKPSNRLIFFQEICAKDIDIAKEFNCNYIGNNTNIGILNAFIRLVEECKTEYFIFCENDWNLIENKEITEKILYDSIEILNNEKANIIKLRHRINPGNPLYSRPKNVDEWLNANYSGFPYKLESLSWLDDPNKTYNNLFEEFNGKYKWYITTLQHQSWSNNIFICKTTYLLNIIIPLLNYFITSNDKYLGLEDILINYKKYLGKNNKLDDIINQYSNIKIAGGNGLFTHKDF
jgi:hypothetical protein